jgi:hypothetical protein
MTNLSKGNAVLIKAAIITGIIDIVSKVSGYYLAVSENEIGFNQEKILSLAYLTVGILITTNLFKFKKWALYAYLAFWIFTILFYWFAELSHLRISGVIGSIIGFNFLSIFTIIVLFSKRRFFVK